MLYKHVDAKKLNKTVKQCEVKRMQRIEDVALEE